MPMTCKAADVTVRIRSKIYHTDGKKVLIHFQLDLEGTRAYLVWDTFTVGRMIVKARVELNPRLLRRIAGKSSNYFYRGKITLPRPENN